ncbi:MAG TPA: hypothetical protein VMH87_13160 [Pseudomonadales bacterium]|nr:hypothetical protein [Pseudomonadales bacterium]
MKIILRLLIAIACVASVHAQYFSDTPDADAFVGAGLPTLNYGADSLLSVSGSNATNVLGVKEGLSDSFIRFNTAALIISFNSRYGSNNWVVTHAALQLTEQGAPTNSIFNRGIGTFQVRWIANNNWSEGTGTSIVPTTDGISYNSEAGLLNSSTDEVLGTFTNSGANQLLFFYLATPPRFVKAVKAGAEVGLYLTATSPNTGFTFDSREFATNSDWPFLVIAAVPQAAIIGVHPSGNNILLTCTNGAADQTYYTMMSTNVSLPLYKWLPVATNHLSSSGNFSITVTNGAVGLGSKYFTLQTQ